MVTAPFPAALDLAEQIEKYGAYAGLASVVGLAVLSLLYFAQAREVKRLRDWAGRAPERDAELQERITSQAARRAAAPAAAARPAQAKPGQPQPAAKPAGAAAATAAGAAEVRPGQPAPAKAAQAPGRPAPAVALAKAGEQGAPAKREGPADAPAGPAKPGEVPQPATAAARAGQAPGEEATAPAGPRPAVAAEATGAGATVARGTPPPGVGGAAADPSVPRPASPGGGGPSGPAGDAEGETAIVRPGGGARPSAPAPAGANGSGPDTSESDAARPEPPVPPGPARPATAAGARPGAARPLRAGAASATVPPRTGRGRSATGGDGRSPLRLGAMIAAAVLVLGVVVVLIVTVAGGGGGGESATQQPRGNEIVTPTDRGSAPAEPRVDRADTTVAVLNGTTVPGLARQVADRLERTGFKLGKVDNATDQGQQTTSVGFVEGQREAAVEVARLIRAPQASVRAVDQNTAVNAGEDARVVVIVGADRAEGL